MSYMNKLYYELDDTKIDAIQVRYTGEIDNYILAFEEAKSWLELGFKLEKNNSLNKEVYVLIAYATELLLKALLIKNKIHFDKSHDLNYLFFLLNDEDKDFIRKKSSVKELEIIDENYIIINKLITFEDFLSYVSKNFTSLRYDFSKNNPNEAVTIPKKFINNFAFSLYIRCVSKLK